MKFTTLHSDSFEEWLEQRKPLFTATDAASTQAGTDKAIAALWRKKHATEDAFTGNKYTEWGNRREPVIAEYVQENLDPTMEPNSNLLVNIDDERFAATPDMISVMTDGDDVFVSTCQIKTTKNDWGDIRNLPADYMAQVQWEMLVTGAEVCLFVWEVYEETAQQDGVEVFVPLITKYGWVDPDPKLQKKLVGNAEKYFAYEPPVLDDAPDSFEAELLFDELLELERQTAEANKKVRELTARRDAARMNVIDFMGNNPTSFAFGNAIINLSEGKTSARFDRKAFAKEHPDLEKQYVLKSEPKINVNIDWIEE